MSKHGTAGRPVLLAFALAVASTADADSMRCGSRLVHDGDHIEEVLKFCGEPIERSRTWIVRQPRFERGGREYSFPGYDEVPVDLLIYDFGPQKFRRRLRFVAGKLERVETLEHGRNR